jgi:archaellum component FlaC
MSDQPEALRLAEDLALNHRYCPEDVIQQAAAELRRLHAEVERLRASLEKTTSDLVAYRAEAHALEEVVRRLNDEHRAEVERLRMSSDARIFAETYTRLDGHAAKLQTKVERLRETLKQIASCTSHHKGDVVDIARAALKEKQT